MKGLFKCDCCPREVSKLKRVDDQWKCEWCTGEKKEESRDRPFSVSAPFPGFWGGPLIVPKIGGKKP